MADIAPFRGVRYDPSAGDLARLTSPPYDVIAPRERDELERANPYNVVRLILQRDEPEDDATHNKYTRARELLDRWSEAGVLRTDPSERIYLYEQRYRLGGQERVQRGIVAAVSLDEASVLPHERTMAAPVADRLDLQRATQANLEPIVCIYAGEDGPGRDAVAAAIRSEPLAGFRSADGVEHRLWAIDEVRAIEAVRTSLAATRLVIADGHHRYRTAQTYRDERRAAHGAGPWDRMMMFLIDTGWAGPSVLPIHRVVSGVDAAAALAALGDSFEIEEAGTRDAAGLEQELHARREAGRCYVMLDRVRAWWLTLADKEAAADAMPSGRSAAWRELDVAVLHSLVFGRLLGAEPGFVHSAAEADGALASGEATLAFLLAPTPLQAVIRIAEEGEAMPPKSTYFFPKPRSGVVIRRLG